MRAWLLALGVCLYVSLLGLSLVVGLSEDDRFAQDPASGAEAAPLSAETLLADGAPWPDWSVGDAWVVRLGGGGACTVAVVATDLYGYQQGYSCEGARDLATRDGIEDLPVLGAFDRHLSGYHDGWKADFFSWPLTDGKEWDVYWRGEVVQARATFDPALVGPDGSEPGFRIEWTDGGRVVARYDYLPSLRWWGSFHHADGTSLRVERHETNWQGETVVPRWVEANSALRIRGELSGSLRVDIYEEQQAEAIAITVEPQGPYSQRLRLEDGEGRVVHESMRADHDPELHEQVRAVVIEDPAVGEWTLYDATTTVDRINVRIDVLTVHAVTL